MLTGGSFDGFDEFLLIDYQNYPCQKFIYKSKYFKALTICQVSLFRIRHLFPSEFCAIQ